MSLQDVVLVADTAAAAAALAAAAAQERTAVEVAVARPWLPHGAPRRCSRAPDGGYAHGRRRRGRGRHTLSVDDAAGHGRDCRRRL